MKRDIHLLYTAARYVELCRMQDYCQELRFLLTHFNARKKRAESDKMILKRLRKNFSHMFFRDQISHNEFLGRLVRILEADIFLLRLLVKLEK